MKMGILDSKSNVTAEPKRSKVRWTIAIFLFIITIVNYADRSTISLAGPSLIKHYNLTPVQMGYILSAFAWSYMLSQLPGGWFLDRFGAKKVYVWVLVLWSVATGAQGFLPDEMSAMTVVVSLFALRFLMGAFEGPSFPANARLVTAWFPSSERATATAMFLTGQYFAVVIFAPILGWIIQEHGWRYNFIFMGVLGIILAWVFGKIVYAPDAHPRINQAEFDFIKAGGALVDIEAKKDNKTSGGVNWIYLGKLLKNRTLWGINIGQLGLSTITYFFLTWFPIYLVQVRHLSILKAGFAAALPALMGFVGGILGGMFSDYLLKKGYSMSFARKTPIVFGMLVSMTMVIANYVDTTWVIILVMAASFFGKAFAAIGWTIVSDIAPKEAQGLCAGVFNTIANIAGIATPIVIGYIVQGTGSFDGALVFVSAMALVTILSYLVIVKDIKRIEF